MNECDRRGFIVRTGAAMASFGLVPELAGAALRPSEPVRVGLVGAGRQGRAILAQLQKLETVTVVAVCDVDERRLKSSGRRAPGAEPFSDHRSLLDERGDVQAVIVATPTHLHRDVAVDAIKAGKHVYCEGPLAASIDDCDAIAAAARGGSGIYQCGLQGRSNPIYRLAWTFYRSGAARDLVSMRAQHHRKTTWRTPAADPARDRALNWRLDPERSIGLAGEFGTQQFDVMHWFAGKYPVSVSGAGSIRMHDDGRTVPDTIECGLSFDDGVQLDYRATLASSFEGTYEILYGTNATFKLAWTAGWLFKESDAPTQGWEVYANRQQFHNDEGITLIADATKLAEQGRLEEGVVLPHPPLYYALSDFLASVVDGAAVACSIEEGRRSSVVGILANRAVTSGERVAIDEAVLRGA
jgi:predicted dehydrogenase